MAKWYWKRKAYHFRDAKTNDAICWSKGKRGLVLTNNPEMVTCKFCIKLLEEKNVLPKGEATSSECDSPTSGT